MLTYFIDARVDPPGTLADGRLAPSVRTTICMATGEGNRESSPHLYGVRLRRALRHLRELVGRKTRVTHLVFSGPWQSDDFSPAH